MTTGIANASAFDRTRTQLLRVKVGEKRSIAANFASLIGEATIVSAEWLMDTACVVGISNAAIAGKSVSLVVTAVEDGEVGLDLNVDLARPRARGSHRLAALESEVLNRVLSVPGTPPEPEPVAPLPTQLRWAH